MQVGISVGKNRINPGHKQDQPRAQAGVIPGTAPAEGRQKLSPTRGWKEGGWWDWVPQGDFRVLFGFWGPVVRIKFQFWTLVTVKLGAVP